MVNKMRKIAWVASALVLAGGLYSTATFAYETYSGCANCHGDFNSGVYISNTDDTSWGTDLMSGHEIFFGSGSSCNSCHSGNDKGGGDDELRGRDR